MQNCVAFLPSKISAVPKSYHRTESASKSSPLSLAINLNDESENDLEKMNISRRRLLRSAIGSSFLVSSLVYKPESSLADIEGVVTPSFLSDPDVKASVDTANSNNNNVEANDGFKLFSTKSGLKYIELREGTGASPKYGNFVSISYKAYVKLPEGKSTNSKLQEYDSDSSYLVKHGNGRMIPGLDEGLHTMKVGGKRRIIIPPKLGYVGPGVLGPLPDSPIGRYKLNKLLDEMVEVRGGNVVFDVELRSVVEDEADQGYYGDGSLTPEEFNTLRINLQQKAKDSKSGFDLLDAV